MSARIESYGLGSAARPTFFAPRLAESVALSRFGAASRVLDEVESCLDAVRRKAAGLLATGRAAATAERRMMSDCILFDYCF
jgi:hypothetical protein